MSGWPAHRLRTPLRCHPREARIERQRTVDERYHRTNVLAEVCQGRSGIHQDTRIIARDFEGSPGEISTLQEICPRFSLRLSYIRR